MVDGKEFCFQALRNVNSLLIKYSDRLGPPVRNETSRFSYLLN